MKKKKETPIEHKDISSEELSEFFISESNEFITIDKEQLNKLIECNVNLKLERVYECNNNYYIKIETINDEVTSYYKYFNNKINDNN